MAEAKHRVGVGEGGDEPPGKRQSLEGGGGKSSLHDGGGARGGGWGSQASKAEVELGGRESRTSKVKEKLR